MPVQASTLSISCNIVDFVRFDHQEVPCVIEELVGADVQRWARAPGFKSLLVEQRGRFEERGRRKGMIMSITSRADGQYVRLIPAKLPFVGNRGAETVARLIGSGDVAVTTDEIWH